MSGLPGKSDRTKGIDQGKPELVEGYIKMNEKIIIKVGTATLSSDKPEKAINIEIIEKLSEIISRLKESGHKVILVTSGAVALGAKELNQRLKLKTVHEKQTAASIGQVKLMETYERFFSKYKIIIAQILLTRDGFEQKRVYKNTEKTLCSLLNVGVIPIINENDAVASEEIRFGDNDILSALVSKLIRADRLIILTDEDGLYDSNPKINKNAKLISVVKKITPEIHKMASGKGSEFSMGGMKSKLQAAKFATSHGIKTHIMFGKKPENILNILKNNNIGTTFFP